MDLLISPLAQVASFILLISVVITVHELGHYFIGRWFGAAIESFSVGFGRSIFEKTDKRGTRWRVNWLPVGGFVKFVGEIQAPQDTREVVAGPVGRPYTQLGPLQRMAISLGGPMFNFIFAILVLAIVAMTLGIPGAQQVKVAGVDPGTPAAAAGFMTGDVVVMAGSREVKTAADIQRATELSAGEPVAYQVKRGEQTVSLTATPVEATETNTVYKVVQKVGRIGLHMQQVALESKRANPVEALAYGVSETISTISETVTVLRRLVTGRDGLDKMSGPLGVMQLAGAVADANMHAHASIGERAFGYFVDMVHLAAFFSIGVGFFNLLPIPVLDGGSVAMCIAEAATGREIPERVQRVGLTIGLACLISFALVISWNDLVRPGGLLEVFRGL